MKSISKELMGASSILIILSILEQGDTYGYDIMARVRNLSDGRIAWKEGSIYPVLQKLKVKKMIRSYWDLKKNTRPRKYYTITKLGKTALIDGKKDWTLMNDIFQQLWSTEEK